MKSALYISILAVFVSCQCVPDLKIVRSIPADIDLKGVYYPDEKTIDVVFGFETNPSAKLIVDTDSTFKIVSFPASAFDWDDFYDKNDEEVNGSGTWHLYMNNHNATVLGISNHYVYSSDSTTNGSGTIWELREKDGEYYICFGVGDPDACRIIRLKRK